MSNFRIPLSDLDYGVEEEEAVLRVLKTRWLTMGPEVEAFEREFAEMLGVKCAFAISNASAGLHLAMLSLGVGAGDEVIQPAINFVACANMTVAVGAIPVFADIVSLSEPTIDPAHVEQLITPRTKAVVVMHYGGHLCRMAELMQVCRRHGLALIEDACHAVGAAYVNSQGRVPHTQMAGSIGDVSAFSFFGNKNLATGEGGMVATNRGDVAERLSQLRSHGMTTLTWDRHNGHASSYEVVTTGFNYRLDELHAALGRAQLAKLLQNNARRRQLREIYCHSLKAVEGWTIPFAQSDGDNSSHLMVVVAPTRDIRTTVAQTMKDRGIQTSLHYPLVPDFKAFAGRKTKPVPLSRDFAMRAMTLPLFPTITRTQIDEVCAVIGD